MAKHFASRLALIAFATVSIRGLITGADFQGTLQTGLPAVAVFYVLGWVVGELAQRVVEEQVSAEIERQTATQAEPEPSA